MPTCEKDKLSADTAAAPPRREGMRLQRYLALAGIDSRRHSEEYILAGRVTVDGEEVRSLGYRLDSGRHEVRLDGELLRPQPKRYYLLNKPPGCVCTHRDPAGRPRAVDLVPESRARLFTVGRLDESSQGLLLVTNDGELAQRLAHPRYHVTRTYRVQVAGKPTPETLAALRRGMRFAEGRFRVQRIRPVGARGKSTILEMTLTEGKNREIRRLLAKVGHKVQRLERIAFGPLKLGRLPLGRCRPLTHSELKELRRLLAQPQRGSLHHRSGHKARGPHTSRRRPPAANLSDAPPAKR